VAPEPTSRMLTNHACSVARMRSMYLSMRRVVPREPPCGKRATSSSRPRSPSVSWYALIQPMTCAPGRVAPRPAGPKKAAQRGRLCAGRPARRAFRMSLLASCCAQAPMQSSMKAKCWWYSAKMTRKMAYFSGKQGDTKS
jgi:hypothetical protein